MTTDNIGQLIVSNARKFLYAKYVPHEYFHTEIFVGEGKVGRLHREHSGGTGLDCSGFVNLTLVNVYETLGIFAEVPRHVKGFYRWPLAKFVDIEELAGGDLVFLHTNPKRNFPDHIGIYAGARRVIHSSRKEGAVREVDIDRFTKGALEMPKTGLMAAKRLAV